MIQVTQKSSVYLFFVNSGFSRFISNSVVKSSLSVLLPFVISQKNYQGDTQQLVLAL